MTDEKVFTEKELQSYNGMRGRSIYIAYGGIVYDVTHAPKWQTGFHEDLHYSGIDLTRSLPKAPHGEEVFVRPGVKRVGRLITDRE
ncbi:MAG TPA: cytochrome b5 domain-containing protein [Anaerolineae bacterium]|jgi:predicted heme/steroid binding protein|nr:cytochrome b5 domain-containing protein [Anaerolineae bacterium]